MISDLEDACAEAGMPLARERSKAEWQSSPTGELLCKATHQTCPKCRLKPTESIKATSITAARRRQGCLHDLRPRCTK